GTRRVRARRPRWLVPDRCPSGAAPRLRASRRRRLVGQSRLGDPIGPGGDAGRASRALPRDDRAWISPAGDLARGTRDSEVFRGSVGLGAARAFRICPRRTRPEAGKRGRSAVASRPGRSGVAAPAAVEVPFLSYLARTPSGGDESRTAATAGTIEN